MKSEPKAFASLSSGLLARKGAARPAMRPQGFGQGGSGLEDLGWNDMGYDSPKPSLVPVTDSDVPHISRTPLAGLTPVSPVHDQQAKIEQRFTSSDSDEGEVDEDFIDEEADDTAGASFASLAGPYEPQSVGEEEEDEADTLELSSEFSEEDDALPEAMPPAAAVDAFAPLVPFASAFVPSQPEIAPEAAPEPEPAPVVAFVPPAAPSSKPARQPSTRSEPLAKGKAAFTLRLDPSRHLKLRLACAVTGRSAQQLVTRALDELLATMPELEDMAERAPAERVSRKG